jgi:tetratricopeptide (TPR) repeat protein
MDPLGGPPASSGDSGERPRENQFTRAAQDFLDDGFAAETLGRQAEADAAFQQALEQAQQAVDLDETNPRAWLLLGEAAVSAKEYVRAGEAYERALELRPAYLEETRAQREQTWVTLYQLAAPLVNSGEYEEAIEIFGAADAVYEERPEIKVILGQLLAQEGEYESAIQVLEEAKAIIDSPRVEEMDSTTAANWMDQREDIDPTIAQALMLGEMYTEAIPFLQGMIDAGETDVNYALNLATAYRETEQPDEAARVYEEVAQRDGLEPGDYLQLGIGLYQLEAYEEAAVAFFQATDVAPYDRDALELGVNSLQLTYVQSDSIEAPPETVEQWVDAAQRWLDLDPSNPQAYTALAQGLARTEDASRAPELLNAAGALPINVRNLQMTRTMAGANISGTVSRATEDAPSAVQLLFTFYDAAGNVLGQQPFNGQLPDAVGGSTQITVVFNGGEVDGYGYEVVN